MTEILKKEKEELMNKINSKIKTRELFEETEN